MSLSMEHAWRESAEREVTEKRSAVVVLEIPRQTLLQALAGAPEALNRLRAIEFVGQNACLLPQHDVTRESLIEVLPAEILKKAYRPKEPMDQWVGLSFARKSLEKL